MAYVEPVGTAVADEAVVSVADQTPPTIPPMLAVILVPALKSAAPEETMAPALKTTPLAALDVDRRKAWMKVLVRAVGVKEAVPLTCPVQVVASHPPD